MKLQFPDFERAVVALTFILSQYPFRSRCVLFTTLNVFHNTRLCLTVILPNAFWALVLDIEILITFYPLRFSFQFRFCYIPNFKYIQYTLVHTDDKTYEYCTDFKPIWRQHWNMQFNFIIHSGCMHLDAHTHSLTLGSNQVNCVQKRKVNRKLS